MATLAANLRRHFLWLLLATYAVAIAVPGLGRAIALFDFSAWAGVGGRATAPLMLVAVLLFLAAMAVDLSELRVLLQRPFVWILGLVGVWLGPALAVTVAGWLLPAGGATAGLLLGMTLVAAMPVANSSVAWTQQSGGSLPWSLGLVVLSILLTPWATPMLLRLLGFSLSGGEAARLEQLILSLSSMPFIVWVVLPTAAGLLVRRSLGAESIESLRPARQIMSSAILLVLNYANGSLALPKFLENPSAGLLATTAIAALALAVVGVLTAWLLTLALGLDHATGDALRFGLSMKHTGLAFAVGAAAGLEDQSAAMLLIVVAVPAQHLVAGLIDRVASARLENGPRAAGDTALGRVDN